MRRSTRLAVAVAAVLLVVTAAGYTAFWFVAAGRLQDGIRQWADSLRAQNIELTWRAMRVSGFPFALRLELGDAHLRDPAAAVEAHTGRLSGRAYVWDFRSWRLAAPGGLNVTAGPADKPNAEVSARAASGRVTASDDGTLIRLMLDAPALDTGMPLSAASVDLSLLLPPHPPQTHTDPALAVTLDARAVGVPAAPPPLRGAIDEVSLSATVMGPLPSAPPRRAAAAWRDSGGTLELDRFAVRWGPLAISGSGTLALDGDLQPMGGFSGAVEGYDALVAALVAAGRLRASDAGLARLALALVSKAGPDGKPQISSSFTIQNGEMYLGPAKLGPAPRIPW